MGLPHSGQIGIGPSAAMCRALHLRRAAPLVYRPDPALLPTVRQFSASANALQALSSCLVTSFGVVFTITLGEPSIVATGWSSMG